MDDDPFSLVFVKLKLIIISDDFKDIRKALTLTIIPSEMGLTTKG
jgi:hypothetical protein